MYLCNRFKAQMAESVDALVSNTSGATHPGSSPGLGTIKYLESVVNQVFTTLFVFTTSKNEQKQQYTHNFTIKMVQVYHSTPTPQPKNIVLLFV